MGCEGYAGVEGQRDLVQQYPVREARLGSTHKHSLPFVTTRSMMLLGGPTPARFSAHTMMSAYSCPPRNPVMVVPVWHTGSTLHHTEVLNSGCSTECIPGPLGRGSRML